MFPLKMHAMPRMGSPLTLTLCLAIMVALSAPRPVRGQDAAAANDAWIGKRVIQRHNNFPLRNDGQAVLQSGVEIHIYRVQRREADKLWLEGEDEGPSGWASVDQLIAVEDALPYLAERIRVRPDSPFYHALRAAVLTDRRDFSSALNDWNKIIELEPTDAAGYIGRVRVWLMMKNRDQAIGDLSHALKLDPEDPYTHELRAQALCENGQLDLAIADYNSAIRLEPRNPELYYDRAWVWQQKGDKAKAVLDYKTGIELDGDLNRDAATPQPKAPADPDPARAAAGALNSFPLEHSQTEASPALPSSESRPSGASAASFEPLPAPAGAVQKPATAAGIDSHHSIVEGPEALARDAFGIAEPETALEFAARAGAWLQAKMFDKAIADCDEALNLGCRDPRAHLIRGLAWREKHNDDKAIADFNEAIRIDPATAYAYIARSAVWSAKKAYDKAAADLAAALRLEPENPAVHNGRAWLWATCPDAQYRDGRKAVKAATKGCEESDWDEAGIIDTLAAAYAEVGEFASAIKWQTKAIELETDAKEKEEFVARLKLYRDHRPYRDIQR